MRAQPARHTGGILIPLLVAVAAVVYRLLTLRDLSNDHFMQLSLAQQLLFGELPGRDFVDPGQPLASAISAAAQLIHPSPYSEAVLCSAMLAIAAALSSRVVERLTGSWAWGILVAAGILALAPRLYNYPKLLVPAVVLWLLQLYAARPSATLLTGLGTWIVMAALLRHDLGIYAAVATFVGVVAIEWPSFGRTLRSVAVLVAAAGVAALPYLAYVWWTEGVAEHWRVAAQFAQREAHQLQYEWPRFPAIGSGNPMSWAREDSIAALYYLYLALPLVGLAVLIVRAERLAASRPILLASLAILGSYSAFVLRDPLDQRLPDVAVPLLVSATVLLVAGLRSSQITLRVVSLAVMALTAVSIASVGRVAGEIEESQLLRGPAKATDSLISKMSEGIQWPWTKFWPNSGGLPATIAYVDACTQREDFLMLTWASPEYYYFARRRFAGGHVWLPSTFDSERDQEIILSRLARQRPPLVLINKTEREGFGRSFPRVNDFIARHYAPAGSFRHYDDAEILIGVRRGLGSRSTYGEAQWPCQFVEEAGGLDDREG